MKTAKLGQDVLIVGRGATANTAWAIARRLSRRHKWCNVTHPLDGDYHQVTCYNGAEVGHNYRVGGWCWSSGTQRAVSIKQKAEAMRNGGRPGSYTF
jgi:hypothetical protein